MSFFASVPRPAYKPSGAKKAVALPENEIAKVIEKQNRSRDISLPFSRRGAVKRRREGADADAEPEGRFHRLCL